MEKNISNRNYGVDLLRIFSMFLVLVLHILGQGGILSIAKGYNYYTSWFMEILAYPAVNCYGLISGYVGYSDEKTEYNYYKYIPIWIQGVSYSFGITLIAFILKPELIGKRTLLYSLFPITTNHYWYLSSYTALFFAIPWINKLIKNCDKKELKNLILIIFLLFSIFGTVSNYFSDTFKLNNGYSFLWLMCLYIIGAYLKKFEILKNIKISLSILIIILSSIITWINAVFIPKEYIGVSLISYISPTIILLAISYLNLFSKLQIDKKFFKIIKFVTPTVFAVYLIHVQGIIWEYIIKNKFIFIAKYSPLILILKVIFFSFLIFLICLIIEIIRKYIFDRLKIEKICKNLIKFIVEKVANFL